MLPEKATAYWNRIINLPSFKVQENNADAVVVQPADFIRAHDQQLKKIMKEVIDPENVYVVVADKNIASDVVKKANV